jgi:hypothetical protein
LTLMKPSPALGALGDGDVALAIAERPARRGRYAEVHDRASCFAAAGMAATIERRCGIR